MITYNITIEILTKPPNNGRIARVLVIILNVKHVGILDYPTFRCLVSSKIYNLIYCDIYDFINLNILYKRGKAQFAFRQTHTYRT